MPSVGESVIAVFRVITAHRSATAATREVVGFSAEKLPRLHSYGLRRVARAIRAYRNSAQLLRRSGLSAAVDALPARPTSSSATRDGTQSDDATWLPPPAIQDAAWKLLAIGRCIGATSGNCLEEAVAVCAGLRCLGFPADVAVGYQLYELGDVVHAWVSVDGNPVHQDAEALSFDYLVLWVYG